MIRLKSGREIEFNDDFDVFYRNLMTAVIEETKAAVDEMSILTGQDELNSFISKEVMDQSIFISHQLHELSTVNARLTKFLITGLLFNSILFSLSVTTGAHNYTDTQSPGNVH